MSFPKTIGEDKRWSIKLLSKKLFLIFSLQKKDRDFAFLS